jgi:hypothetical protein
VAGTPGAPGAPFLVPIYEPPTILPSPTPGPWAVGTLVWSQTYEQLVLYMVSPDGFYSWFAIGPPNPDSPYNP